jgi:hypothetical protein
MSRSATCLPSSFGNWRRVAVIETPVAISISVVLRKSRPLDIGMRRCMSPILARRSIVHAWKLMLMWIGITSHAKTTALPQVWAADYEPVIV